MNALTDITIIFIAAAIAILASHALRVPSVVGLLVAGIVIGPELLGFVSRTHEIELLAEIGVVLLLFVIGLEFSLASLKQVQRTMLQGGGIQMGLTAAVVGGFTYLMGRTVSESVLIGLIVSLSSTAVVLKILQDRAELESPHGRVAVATLIFQDLAVVPIMLAVPLLAGGGTAGGGAAVGEFALRAIAVLGISYVLMRWVVPWLFYMVARTKSREAFLMAVIAVVAGIALMTSEAGLSLALGAFLAGLIISESEYGHQAVGLMLPFRDAFIGLFFISVGLLLDVDFVLSRPFEIAVLTLGILVLKPLLAGLATLSLGLPLRVAVLTGISLGQIGEFSFIVAGVGRTAGVLSQDLFQTVLATAIFSIIATPFLIQGSPRIADLLMRLPWPQTMLSGDVDSTVAAGLHGHVVIIGYGVTGRNVAEAAAGAGVPFSVIEIAPKTVREELARGTRIIFGDATQPPVLKAAEVAHASAVVVAIDDPIAARRVVQLVRQLAPDTYIIVRSRYVRAAPDYFELGADDVVTDELEVSLEILALVLGRCLVPREDIDRCVTDAREDWRRMQRSPSEAIGPESGIKIDLPDLATRTFRLEPDSPIVGKTIAESQIRQTQGVTVLAIRRANRVISNPVGAERFEPGDVLFVIAPVDWEPRDIDAPSAG